MTITTRSASPADLDTITDLMMQDARARCAADPVLWALAHDAATRLRAGIQTAMEAEAPPFRQHWMLAEAAGHAVGVAHSIRLPVPPIYAGAFGQPGLIMEDCFVTNDAPSGAGEALLAAAETDLVQSGAQILLGSSVAGGALEPDYRARGYRPLTLYLGKIGLSTGAPSDTVRNATEADLPAIVALSAENRALLHKLDGFWEPHPDADARFMAWMGKSLTLDDRDMFVSEHAGAVTGYAISQPVTPLHIPAAHDISATGIIDDFFHAGLSDPDTLSDGAAPLLHAAEAARAARVNTAVLIVCPAAWTSRTALLEQAGYRTALTWFIKR